MWNHLLSDVTQKFKLKLPPDLCGIRQTEKPVIWNAGRLKTTINMNEVAVLG